jgi:hypothetical protein
MRDNWALFSDTFGEGKSFDQHIAAVTTARNAFAHSNHIGNADLLSAEAGLISVEECLRRVEQSQAAEVDEDEVEDSVAEPV